MINLLLRRLAHYAVYLLAAGISICSVIALVLRFWILPDIQEYKSDIESIASQATGLRVTIDALAGDWQGLSPHIQVEGLRFTTPLGVEALTLPHADARLSWTSLLFADLRFASILLKNPRLLIQRDRSGVIHVAGITITQTEKPSPFPDWLLRQPMIAVQDGSLTWEDAQLEAPPLDLSGVHLMLRNRLGHHRFGVLTHPPRQAAQHIDLRGEFSGRSIRRLEAFKGTLYARIEGASAEALHTWAPWSQSAVKSGHGNLQFWLQIADRQAKSLVGDVKLRDVRLTPSADLSDFVFADLSGRLSWKKTSQGDQYAVEQLAFTSPQGMRAAPTNLRVLVKSTPAGKAAVSRIETERLHLEALMALTGSVPIPRQAHDLIETLRPHGLVERLSLDWQDAEHFAISARVKSVGIQAGQGLPGISGISGDIEATQARGVVRLNSSGVKLDESRVFRHPLAFDSLTGELTWQGAFGKRQQLVFKQLQLANADLEGSAQGTITLEPGHSPVMDLSAELTRGNAAAIWRYLPRRVSEGAYQWISDHIRGGVSNSTRMVLRGPAAHFPFANGEGTFRVEIDVHDGLLEPAHGWPQFTHLSGQVVFHEAGLDIHASGQVLGAHLKNVRGTIPDLHHPEDTTLIIEGQARGDTQAYLDYIRSSPLRAHIGHFTETLRATGPAQLNLKLKLPFHHMDDSQVSGALQFADASLDAGHKLPVMKHIRGRLQFTRHDFQARSVTGTLLGQPATLDITNTGPGRFKAAIAGRAGIPDLNNWIPASLTPYLKGTLGYRAESTIQQGKASLSLTSDLSGLAVLLPAPLEKPADQSIPLQVDIPELHADDAKVLIRYGNLISAQGIFPTHPGQARLGIRIGGGDASLPQAPGLTLVAQQKKIDLDSWRRLTATGTARSEPPLPIHSVSLTASELLLFGHRLSDAHMEGMPAKDGWTFDIGSREVRGRVSLTTKAGVDHLQARLGLLALPLPASSSQPNQTAQASPRIAADITSDKLLWEGKALGSLQLLVSPADQGLRIDKASLSNDDDRLTMSGTLATATQGSSSVSVSLNSENLGKLLDRLGYPGRLRRGEAQVTGTLNWKGGLDAIGLAKLTGTLQANLKKGQFSKIDPGAARLLGILSLQSLPRRITLDFRDIFSEGFAFDEISSPVYLQHGTAYLSQFKMRGPAARIDMKGQIDLVQETQALRVSIEPRLDDTLAAGAMIINPAIGVGALVASKVLQNPLSKAATFEYLVTGSWEEPVVKRTPRTPSPQSESSLGEP